MLDVKAIEDRHSAGTYVRRDLVLVRGQGARVWDAADRSYIDCLAGVGVAAVGHAHPRVVEAVARQARQLITCYEACYNDARARFYEALGPLLPAGLSRFFLCNSGTEAVEAALKFARLATGRPEVVAMQRGFHGKTFGALSATWNPKYRQGFEPLLADFCHVPFNDTPALEKALEDGQGRVGAVILELMQGEGGVWPAQPEFVRAARELCNRTGALLIFDEIQTGVGRTGRFLAAEHYGVVPDLLTLAKGIAGGLPMGVAALGERVGSLPRLAHTSTFGGNPLACAAGAAVLACLREEGLIKQAAEKGAYFLDRLRRLPSRKIRAVRGLGLMLGLELRERAQPYLARLLAEGVLALLAGTTVIRLLPPLVITHEEIDEVVGALEHVLAEDA